MEQLSCTKRSRVRRGAKRASYQKAEVFRLIDELKLGHIGFEMEGQVYVIPMTVWRLDDHLYFHVANKSRLQRYLESGKEVCLSFAECREWVLAKSAYHHSANYRSAVMYCAGERVTDEEEFDGIFAGIINQIAPDRWDQVRPPSVKERKATALMKLTILEGAYKARTGGPNEEEMDLARPVWHGVVPARHNSSL